MPDRGAPITKATVSSNFGQVIQDAGVIRVMFERLVVAGKCFFMTAQTGEGITEKRIDVGISGIRGKGLMAVFYDGIEVPLLSIGRDERDPCVLISRVLFAQS